MKKAFNYFIINLLVFFLTISPCLVKSQHIHSALRIEGASENDGYKMMIHDQDENYYVGLDYATNTNGILVGDTILNGTRVDNLPFNLYLSDFHLLKFNPDHELLNHFSIDNSEQVYDFSSSGKYNILGLSIDKDYGQPDAPYPITFKNGITIPREGNRGAGCLVVLDENLQFLDTIFLTSGPIGEIAIDGEFVYLECIIPDDQEYILIEEDTVYNIFIPNTQVGNSNVVLCKYDLSADSVLWWLRIGGFSEEKLIQMEVLENHNLLIHGYTWSGQFTFDGIDTVINQSPHNPFIGIYSPDGTLVKGILNQHLVNDSSEDLAVDQDGYMYLAGYYYGPKFSIGDTTIFSQSPGPQFTFRPIITKYDAEGNFRWVYQLDGTSDGFFTDITIHNNEIIVSGTFRFGTLHIGPDTLVHSFSTGLDNAFLLKLNKLDGSFISYSNTEGEYSRTFRDLYVDQQDRLNTFLILTKSAEIFNQYFEERPTYYTGNLLQLTTDFISNEDIPIINDKLNIYPSPIVSGSQITIEIKNIKDSELSYKLSSLEGKIVDSGSLTINNNLSRLKIPHIPNGLYLLTISNKSDLYSKTIYIN